MSSIGSLFSDPAKVNVDENLAQSGTNLTAGALYGNAPGQVQTNQFGGGIGTSLQNALNTTQQQQAFANQLQQQANGTGGPNLGQQLLNKATQQNNEQAAGAIAGQRGLNPALGIRMALDQQAGNNQTAAGQAATERMQEQLSSEQLLAQQQSAIQQGNLSTLGTAGGLQQGQDAQALQRAQMEATQAAQNAQLKANAQSLNAGVQQGQQQLGTQLLGGLIGGASSIGAAGAMGKADGGRIDRPVPSMLSPGEAVIDPEDANDEELVRELVAHVRQRRSMGGRIRLVPGQASVRGDSPRNDTVPASLRPGTVILPRTVMNASDAPQRAAEFVRHLPPRGGGADGAVARMMTTKRDAQRRREALAQLERAGSKR